MAPKAGTDKNSLGDALKAEVLTPGEKFGDYQVFQCLNFGFLGGLYVMQHIREFTEVCIHVIPSLAQEDPRFKERLREVTNNLKELDHPNVLKFRETVNIKGRTCLLYEPVQGINLSEYLENFVKEKQQRAAAGGTPLLVTEENDDDTEIEGNHAFGLPASVVRDALRQSTEGVRAAHEKRVRHLTLTPNNLILTKEGVVKVGGLGIYDIVGREYFERLVSAGISPVQVGPRKFFVNAIDSLSPEMRRGLAGDVRSDLYGLGVSGYFLLTGHRPGSEPPPPSSYSATIPDGWDRIMAKCLERDLEKRYATPAALLSDLDRLEKITASVTSGENSLSKQLERIPLPKSVSRRFQPKTIRIIRLSILSLFALVVIYVASTSYNILFSDPTPQNVVPLVQKIGPNEKPHLNLTIQPARTTVRVTGRAAARFNVTDGQLRLRMPIGTYDVALEAPGYVPLTIPLEITNATQELELMLEQAFGRFTIKSVPLANVTAVAADGTVIPLGTTSRDGELTLSRKLGIGTYTIAIEKEHYASALISNVTITDKEPVIIEQMLEPDPGILTITSDPAGATVIINGESRGTTPLTIEEFPVLTDTEVVIEQAGFQPIRRIIRLEAGEERTLEMGDLAAKMGIVTTRITLDSQTPDESTLSQLEIELAGQLLSSSQNEFAINVGKQKVSINHPDYFPVEKELTVKDGEISVLRADLKPRPSRVLFHVEPQGIDFTISLDGKKVDLENDRISFSPGEDHIIEIAAPDHLLLRRSVNLPPNRELIWEAKLTAIPSPEKGKEYLVPYVGIPLVPIEAGTFTMGSPLPEQDRRPVESPMTTVRISKPFWAGVHEVTQQQYLRLTGANPSYFRESSNTSLPVEQVTWQDAMEYCRRLTEQERKGGRLPQGYVYRLPTEAEWEYFTRAGTETPFSWGDTATPEMGNLVGVYPRELSRTTAAGRSRTIPVGSFQPNAWGLYDVHGNVREWCLDDFASRYEGGRVTDPLVHQQGNDKVVRGGSWEDVAHRNRSATRERYHPTTSLSTIGFRIVLAPENELSKF